MAFTKFASLRVSDILDVKGSPTRLHTASLDKVSDYENYRTSDGYMYVRLRAISSRVNKNHDGWPTLELAGSPDLLDRHTSSDGFTVEAADGNTEYGFATFPGKPIFVDHNNSDPKKTRGVIADAKFRTIDAKTAQNDPYWGGHEVDAAHLPASEIELLLEIDAKTFPHIANAILSGDLDGFSMGADVEKSICSHCGHVATNPDEYCSHILMKGAHHDFKTAEGMRTSKKSYENCYGVKFFEISAVFDPADETATAREVRANVYKEAEMIGPGGATPPDPVRSNDMEIQFLADSYVRTYNMDPQTALQMAQEKWQTDHPTPGHGEGPTADGQPKQWQYNKWPEGLTLPQSEMGGEPATNDPRWSATKTAENPLPQSFNTHAPEEVDTLRDEQLCPVCGSDMEGETCDVCGFVEPPKGFDNPDLDKAQQIRDKMKQTEEDNALGEGQQPPEQAPGATPGGPPGAPQPGGPLTGPATKSQPTASVTNEMNRSWTPKVHPKTAARINQVETPLVAPTVVATNEPKNEIVTKDQTKPVTAAMLTAQRLIANAQRNHTGEPMSTRTADGATSPGDTSPTTRVDVTGIGGVDQASNENASKADAQVDVTGIGTTGVEGVESDSHETLPTAAEKSDDAGFNTDKTTEDSGPTSTFGDSDGSHSGVTDPVTSEPFPASADGVHASQRVADNDGTLEDSYGDPAAKGGTAVKGVQPVAETFGERVNLLEHKTSPANNSGPTDTWSGTDGNGVLKQQDPITKEKMEWGGVPVPDVQLHTKAHFMAALQLTELEQELGLVSREDKYNRIAQHDSETPEQVKTQIATLSTVKTAGLAKLASTRTAGVRRLPSAFGKQTAAPHGFERIAAETVVEPEPVDDSLLDSALFSR